MEVIAKKNTAKRNTVFTSEQLEKAKSLGISKRALYKRVWKGMPAEIACTKPMRTKKNLPGMMRYMRCIKVMNLSLMELCLKSPK